MPLKKSAGKKAENKERNVRAKARKVAIKKFGDKAVKGKEVHHRDGNNKNNSPSNLGLRNKSSHGKKHGRTNGKRGKRSVK